jgi:hypothetical protein
MMRAHIPNSGSLAITVMLAVGLIPVRAGKSQVGDKSAAKLIHFLTDPVERPDLLDKNGARIPDGDRAAANLLVAMGSAAIDDLDAAFDLIERQGQETPLALNSKWLLFAYARIRGPEAYQRLRAMIANPRLRFLRGDLDHSLAMALGLTSYVSASRVAYQVCCRTEEPRDSLDRLVLAWMQGNRLWMEEELGPNGRLALGSLAANRSWLAMRATMWHGVPDSDLAIGFRFESPSDWSKPEETLDQALQDRRSHVDRDQFPTEPKLLTQFVDRAGNGCAPLEVRFVRVPRGTGGLGVRYVVDEADLEGLLRTVSECALRSP